MSQSAVAGQRVESPLGDSFHIYDTTLRDGAQREGITYSVADKLAVARLLDELGVGFIEGGWPGALPKDTEFFERAATELDLVSAQLVAFGSTRKAGAVAAEDPQVKALVDSHAPVICLVAKSDVRHVERALRTTRDENLEMVRDTVSYLVSLGRRVFVDCEHFFDGYKFDAEYAVAVLQAAFAAGADVGVMCDTNGGMLPLGIHEVVCAVKEKVSGRLGIHCQDDTGCAVANSITAVAAGVTHVQMTANGYGERTGNADLFAVIGGLSAKLDMPVLPDGKLTDMQRISHALADIANLSPDTHQPYVGASSFAHKAGLHASAIKVAPELYNHMDPAEVGNDMRILVTEMAGRASVELKGKELGVDLTGNPAAIGRIVATVKDREAQGWSYEAADASFELLMRAELDSDRPTLFDLESYRVIVEHRGDGEVVSEATVKIHLGERRVIATAEGNGPVNALDQALRDAVIGQYPQLASVELSDYKVRILEGRHGTDATTRVLIGTTDGERDWTTVGVHPNVVEASWKALVDALVYTLQSDAG